MLEEIHAGQSHGNYWQGQELVRLGIEPNDQANKFITNGHVSQPADNSTKSAGSSSMGA